MYITAGKHHRRRIEVLEGKEIRPTASRVRQAIFNILTHAEPAQGDDHLLVEQRVADICCGSGALGLEALSRGASHVTFVDMSGKSLDVARRNVEHIGEESSAAFVRCDATQLSTVQFPCSVVFLDPPYGKNLTGMILDGVDKKGWLKSGGMAVVELATKDAVPDVSGYELVKDREYGNTRLVMYRKL